MFDVTLNAPLILDPKGRVTLPTRIASVLKARLVSGESLEPPPVSLVWTPFLNHLRAYAPSTWRDRVVAPLLEEDSFDPAVADRQRRRTGLACQLEMDPHGRVVLPPFLRERAGLSRDCVIVSLVDRLELWDAARFAAWVEGE